MTEEEIRPIAEDYVEEYCHCPDGEYTDGSLVCAGIGTALIVSRQLEKRIANLEEENAELKELIEKYRQAVDKCLHITFMGAGCEVKTIGQYATLVDGYLTDVEGLAKWKK